MFSIILHDIVLFAALIHGCSIVGTCTETAITNSGLYLEITYDNGIFLIQSLILGFSKHGTQSYAVESNSCVVSFDGVNADCYPFGLHIETPASNSKKPRVNCGTAHDGDFVLNGNKSSVINRPIRDNWSFQR